jgi:4-diphosphocytidyl-2-C-methyl-D-erythritol kinase
MDSLTLKAPAKVNLFLKILRKRPDGYHDILTLFERIAIFDTITLRKARSGITICCNSPITRDVRDNLMYKAADLIIKTCRVKGGVNIRIKKRIPVAAGLGGGSSDAAAVLAGMNRIFGLRLTGRDLMRLGRKLGADVGFFLYDSAFAIGAGRGDVLEGAGKKTKLWHLVVYPGPLKASTKEIYHYLDIIARGKGLLTTPRDSDKITLHLRQAMDIGALEAMLHNDLESALVAKKKVIGSLSKRLASSLGRKIMVSGSGPSLFCLYATKKEAKAARAALLKSVPPKTRKLWRMFVAGTCI